jgi:phosphotransacetylase
MAKSKRNTKPNVKSKSNNKLNHNKFIDSILKQAKKNIKTIILAEPEDDRVLKAAEIITLQKIAKIILVGNKRKTETRIQKLKLKLKNIQMKPEKTNR